MQLIENVVMFALFISNFIVYMLNWDKEKKYLFSCIITIIGFSLYLVSKFSVTTGLIIILMGGIGIVYYQNNSEGSLDGKRIDFFLRWTITEKVTRNFIYIGISIIFLVLSFEFLYGNNAIGQSSTLVLIFSLVLLLYDFIPEVLSYTLNLIVFCLLISLFKLKFNGLISGFIESLDNV